LHGVPLGIKDIIDVAGLATRAGSPLRADLPAKADSPLVAALRQSGAIILGKTVTVEFACFDPSPTRNPWDPRLEHTPGGSSSGSAAAVAMGMCPGAIGTQTGGSLVRPASYCGVAAFKPTFARVDTTGIVPVSPHLDHPGPMARSVEDLELLFTVLPRSRDFGPPTAERLPLLRPGETTDRPLPPQLGLVEEFFMEQADTAVREVVRAAIEKLTHHGAAVEPAALGLDFEAVQEVHTRIMAADAAAYHREQFLAHRFAYGPMIASLLDRGLGMPAVEYAAALEQLRQFRLRIPDLFDGLDALVMPATDTTAPATLATTGNKKFQCPWSCAGVPVVSLPCGLASDGMPVALQLVAPYHHDERLLRVARWCEQRLEFRAQPPLLDG
jgi:aspartyl-tRNA(Asn)/glutamyl-tRNA(Gln) amidotransferase subunit A